MNKAIRCEARDDHGHRCTKKKGHTDVLHKKPRKGQTVGDDAAVVRQHAAFGKSW